MFKENKNSSILDQAQNVDENMMQVSPLFPYNVSRI